MRPPLSRIPLLPAAIGVASGIVFALWFPGSVMGGSILATFIAGVLIWRNEWWIAMITLSAIAGAFTTIIHNRELTESLTGEWGGEIIDTSHSDRASMLDVEIYSWDNGEEWTKISPFMVKVFVPSPDSTYLPGQNIRFAATFIPPTNDTDLPYQTPERLRLRDSGFVATVLITQDNITTTGYTGWRTLVNSIRTHLADILLRSPLKSRTKEFITAALFGYRHLLSPDTLESFEKGGISHVLAISGLHIGILVWILSLLLWPVRLLSRHAVNIFIIIFIWSYALLTGFSPSVTRAVVMISMILAGDIIQRDTTPFNSLLLAFVIILLASPLSLFNVGFQMSFCAVASILLFTHHFNPVSPKHHITFFLSNTLAATLAATLSVGIISAFYFHSFPLLFLLSNLVLALLLPLILSSGITIIIFSLLSIPTGWLCNITDYLYNLNTLYLQLLDRWSFTTLENLYFPGWVIALWILGLITLKLRFTTHKKVFGYFTAILLTSSAIIVILPNRSANDTMSTNIYFQRQKMFTTIIIERPETNSLELMTSATPHTREQLMTDFMEDNRDWITLNNIKQVKIIDSDTINAYNLHLIMLHQGKRASQRQSNFTHAVICRGFTGTLDEILDSISVDTFILSYDMHPRVFRRLKLEAEEHGLPYVSLKDSTYSIVAVPQKDTSRSRRL